jgi:predicted lysophospholipase L1 biosynthesis ABC-type transport system permease subunit
MSVHARAALISLVLVAAVLPNAVAAQASQSLAGTWKLNAAKSKYEPAELAAKSSTVTYAFSGNSVTATIDQVNAKGQKVHIEYTATLDGADSPWKGTIDGKPNTGQDAVTFKKLNANTYHVENKLKGKVTTINHIVVAADGKSRTATTTGTNAEGQKVNNVAVYDKQ